MILPVNKDMLAGMVKTAIDFFPDIWEVSGFQIRCSLTDINLDKERTDVGDLMLADATITVLNSDIEHKGIGFDTRGIVRGTPIRIHSIIPGSDGRTTQFNIRKDRER